MLCAWARDHGLVATGVDAVPPTSAPPQDQATVEGRQVASKDDLLPLAELVKQLRDLR